MGSAGIDEPASDGFVGSDDAVLSAGTFVAVLADIFSDQAKKNGTRRISECDEVSLDTYEIKCGTYENYVDPHSETSLFSTRGVVWSSSKSRNHSKMSSELGFQLEAQA